MAKQKSKKLKLKKKVVRKLGAADLGKAKGGTGTFNWCQPDGTDQSGAAEPSYPDQDYTEGSFKYTGGTGNHNQAVRL